VSGTHLEIACVVATKPNSCACCGGYIGAGERIEFEAPRTVKHIACSLAARRRGDVMHALHEGVSR
jgi:hypothetical protein